MGADDDRAALKAALRQRMRVARDALDPATRAAHATRIRTHLVATPEYLAAPVVAGYLRVGAEADPAPCLVAAEADGKVVVLPRVEAPGVLSLRRHRAGDPLSSGPMGLREPAADAPILPPDEVALFLLPGLAFDARGGRLGYGGGYYDRLLSAVPGALCFGVAHALQLVERVPTEPHDVAVRAVISERGLRRCGP